MDRANHGVRDAQHVETKALPAPVLNTTELPDTQTMIYDVQCDADEDFTDATTIAKEVIKQTGAGAAGAAAVTARFRVPSTCEQYVRIAATKSGAGTAATAALTHEVLY